jgi:hypothetical protein
MKNKNKGKGGGGGRWISRTNNSPNSKFFPNITEKISPTSFTNLCQQQPFQTNINPESKTNNITTYLSEPTPKPKHHHRPKTNSKPQ